MYGQITGQVWKSLLESGDEVRHIRCPKPDNLVSKTGYPGFDMTEN
jgi:hypothetical protein